MRLGMMSVMGGYLTGIGPHALDRAGRSDRPGEMVIKPFELPHDKPLIVVLRGKTADTGWGSPWQSG